MQQSLYIDADMLQAAPLTPAMLGCFVQVLPVAETFKNNHNIP
jgi:hypothetical protein